MDVTQGFDGDGLAVKKLGVETLLDSDPEGNVTTTKTSYLLRSNVLGGQVVSELGSESEQRGFVYLGDTVLALQYRTTQTVNWEHRDAGNASVRMTSSNGSVSSDGKAELDPLGSNAGVSAPVTPSPAQYWKISGYPGLGSSGTSMTCMMDFIPTPCSDVGIAVNNRSAAQCPDNNCNPVQVIYQGKEAWAFFNAYGDGFQGYIPDGAVYTENGNFVARSAGRPRLRTDTSNDTNFSRLNGATGEVHLARVQQVFHHPQKTLTIEHFTAAQESWIRYEMEFILTKKCSDAYEAERLHSPSNIISGRGVVIRHAKDLGERSAADLGLDPRTYRDAQTKINSGQGGTVLGIDGTLQIYLNSYAFVGPSWDGKYFSLAETLKHEFIHEGIREWRSPWHPFSHDLRGYPGYDRIMEGCK